jgi:integrase
LNHVWTHQPEDRKGAIGAFNPEVWRKVKPFRGADAARLRYLQADEARRLLNACPADFRNLVRGALAAGCRYGELCRLEVRDYSPDAGALLIRQSKSGKPRHVPLDDDAVAFFAAITAGRPSDERMFCRADGSAWGKSHQARPLIDACRAARIDPPANFHCLRHTWASHRVMRGPRCWWSPRCSATAIRGWSRSTTGTWRRATSGTRCARPAWTWAPPMSAT